MAEKIESMAVCGVHVCAAAEMEVKKTAVEISSVARVRSGNMDRFSVRIIA
jgi:hypothetical protein